MRINRIIVMCLVATCLLTSCNKKNPDDNVPEDGFVATIEQNGGDSNGRTHINPDSWADGASVSVLWTKDDLIKVANGNGTTLPYQLTEGENKKRGVFYTGEPHENFFQPNYVAIYPAKNAADIANTINGTTATFNLPATQTYKENSFAEKCQPMVAYSNTQTLQFKNVLGCICFPLVGDGITLTSVVLTSNNSSDRLWGTCTTTISTSGGAPSSDIANNDSNKHIITLDCGTVTLDPVTPKYFCIIVPPGTLASGFTVAMYNGSNKINEISTNKNARIRRSVISETSNITVAADPVFTEKQFSVASGTKVYFSPGNLQYKNGTGWRFAENQWDYVGGWNTSNWIDLFGWGTSGWNSNVTSEPNYLPTSTSTEELYKNPYDPLYYENPYGYGPTAANIINDFPNLTGNYDWGVYNSGSISGGEGKSWRTLTQAEWTYLFNTRNTPSGIRYAKANVNYVNGVILLPDDWSASNYSLSKTNQSTASYSSNVISSTQWNTLKRHGAVFLPAAGSREESSVSGAGSNGYYWSTTNAVSTYGVRHTTAYCLSFASNSCLPGSTTQRYMGCSVRLVHQ